MAKIAWHYKKQGFTEDATFGSQFIAMKTAMKANRAL
jgi:hypothetical protein